MEPERWQRVQALFYEAELLAPDEQRALLERACAGEESLRREVQTLLNFKTNDLLQDAVGRAAAAAQTAFDLPELPEYVGDYRVIRKLGEGGMGVVYEAEQMSPRRLVAVKVIRAAHFAGRRARQLFEREAEALGRLKHPGIATIYQSGVAEGEIPFIAMELVAGTSLTEWALSLSHPKALRKEDIGKQLRVFRLVCEAILYAHQNGVIHRDLKPSNVLVTSTEDSDSEAVKVLDFGLARILEHDEQNAGLTETGVVQGSIPYMSPEQAMGSSGEIDVRADIYALGVILYWMLTRQHPYLDGKMGLAESLQLVLQGEPKRFRHWFRNWDSDLEVIVLKAMQKEPKHRYQSVSTFAGDIDRYLEDLPILARAPSGVYQMRKLIRRNRAGFVALLSIFLLAIGMVISTIVQSRRIAVQRDRANQEAATAQQVSDFMVDLFRKANPVQAGAQLTARDLLRTGKERASKLLKNQPEIRARLLDRIGDAYEVVGPQTEARSTLLESIHTRDAAFGRDSLASATSWSGLSTIAFNEGNYPAAEENARHALRLLAKYLPPDDAKLAEPLDNLASALVAQGKFKEAEAESYRAIEIDRHHPDTDGIALSGRLAMYGNILREQGNYTAAIPILRKAVEISSRTPDGQGQTAYNLNELAVALGLSGNAREAEEYYRRDLEVVRAVYGPENMNVAMLMSSIADCLNVEGRYQEAETLARRALAAFNKAMGPNHPRRTDMIGSLGDALDGEGKNAEAGSAFRERLEICAKSFGEDHIRTVRASIRLAEWEARSGSLKSSLARVAANKQIMLNSGRKTTADWGLNARAEGYAREAMGDSDGARTALSESCRILTNTLGVNHWQTQASIHALTNLR